MITPHAASAPRLVLLLVLVLVAASSSAADSPSLAPAPATSAGVVQDPPERALAWEHGTVTVGDHIATINLPANASYLQRADARWVMEIAFHNPEDPSTIGLVRVLPAATAAAPGPAGVQVAPTSRAITPDDQADDEDAAMGILGVVSYDTESGHVKDDDAATVDYAKLLAQLQDQAKQASAEAHEHGFAAYTLLGWAEPPHYDSAAKVLYWAESARFENSDDPVLNYKVRILGARGVLEINYVDLTKHLAQVRAAATLVMPRVAFASGNAYADFHPGDKVAKYGLGGLIAGGALYGAMKLGFFALIGKFLLAFIKPILVGAMVLIGAIAKFFRRSSASEPVLPSPPHQADAPGTDGGGPPA